MAVGKGTDMADGRLDVGGLGDYRRPSGRRRGRTLFNQLQVGEPAGLADPTALGVLLPAAEHLDLVAFARRDLLGGRRPAVIRLGQPDALQLASVLDDFHREEPQALLGALDLALERVERVRFRFDALIDLAVARAAVGDDVDTQRLSRAGQVRDLLDGDLLAFDDGPPMR